MTKTSSGTNYLHGGVLFCGGCNTRYDRLLLYHNLQSYFSSHQNDSKIAIELQFYDPQVSWDFLVLINGCSSECLLEKNWNLPMVLLNGADISIAVQKIIQACKTHDEKRIQ